MARNRKTVLVDREKLEKKLRGCEATLRAASLKMGYAENYLANAFNKNNGLVPTSAVMLLESIYGITLDDIKPDEPEVCVEQTEIKMEAPSSVKDEIVAAIREILYEDSDRITTLIAMGLRRA